MNTGRRIANPQSKRLAGTYREDRHGSIAPIAVVPNDHPICPDWLPAPAKAIWQADIGRIIACGATSVDSSMVALYCVTMADFVAAVGAGDVPNASFRSELRKQAEMLGIAGAKSRLAKIGTPDAKASNPFAAQKPILVK